MRKLQIGLVGEGEPALVREAASICARRGSVLLMQNTALGVEVVSAGEKIPNFRYISFEHPQKNAPALDIRVKHPTEVSSLEALFASADGIMIFGEPELALAISRKSAKPIVRPKKPEECLEAVTELLNRMISEIRQ
jgi:hypothetical protein